MMRLLSPLIASVAGYTSGFAREELILAAAVGGTLSTFGVVGALNMGWVGNSNDGAHIADALQTLESANLKFYQRYGMWPDEVSDGTPAGNVAVLADSRADVKGALRGRGFHPLIQADMDVSGGSITVRYRAAGGAAIGETALSDGGTYRYMVTLDHLTLSQARKIDEKIDGEFNPDAGRVRVAYSPDGKQATIKYYINARDMAANTQ
jgi:hypothetical protein